MITVIHGSDTMSSFAALKKILNSSDELSLTRLVGSDLKPEILKEALETPSFTGTRTVVVEDLSRNRSNTLVTSLKKYLADLPEKSQLVIYERRLLPPESPILSLSKNVKNFSTHGGTNVFEWADQVGKRDLSGSLAGWEKLVLSGEEPDYLFLMLVRQFRLLLLLKKGERPKVPEFVQAKLRGQLKFWGGGDLEVIYRKLLLIDRENKTGATPLEVSVPGFLASIGRQGVRASA